MVGGFMFKAVSFIRRLDADGAREVAYHLFVVMDDIQLDEHPWTARHAIPFLQSLIQRCREGQFDALTRR
jgi:hypothetical protein